MIKSIFSILLSAFAILTISGCGTSSPETVSSAEPTSSVAETKPADHVEVSAAKFKEHVEDDHLVLAKFGAPWCGPCREVDVELDKLEANNGSELTVVRINVDEEPGLAEDYSVSAIPALFLFKDGKQVKDWLGYAEASEFQESIDELK